MTYAIFYIIYDTYKCNTFNVNRYELFRFDIYMIYTILYIYMRNVIHLM